MKKRLLVGMLVAVMTLISFGNVVFATSDIVYGDVNEDGKVTNVD